MSDNKKLIAGVEHVRVPCQICGELIWSAGIPHVCVDCGQNDDAFSRKLLSEAMRVVREGKTQ